MFAKTDDRDAKRVRVEDNFQSPVRVYSEHQWVFGTYPCYNVGIFQFMGCSMSVYVYALILLDRVQERHANFLVTAQNLHRLTITSVTIGAKYLDDFFYKNSYYATVGGVSTVLLNQMEAELLRLLDYDCSVSPECFQAYL